jgi:uncharacterized protein YceH (UPF0502 family)
VRRAALAVALLLSACGQPGLNERQQDEAADLAADVATDTIDESRRIAALEIRVEELEARLEERGIY